MSSFSITPVQGYPVATGTEPKRSIQFQFNGVNVGERNTDIVDFGDLSQVLSVTIGVGEAANVLTVNSVAEGAGTAAVWLDTFTGTTGTDIDQRAQDTPFNGSVWAPLGGDLIPSIYAGTSASSNASFPTGAAAAITRFDTGSTSQLAWGWEITASLMHELISENSPRTVFTLAGEGGELVIALDLATGELTAELGSVEALLQAVSTETATYPVRVVMNETTAAVYLSGVLTHTFTDGTFRTPLYASLNLTGEDVVSPRVDRVGFSGTISQVTT